MVISEALAEIKVADSHFLGFCAPIVVVDEIDELKQSLKRRFPDAAHAPAIWVLNNGNDTGFDEDGEPEGSVGPGIVNVIQQLDHKPSGIVVLIVRYFGNRLLGVTCGRLTQCYQSIARSTLYRFLNPQQKPFVQEFMQVDHNLYGLASGDCELILNVIGNNDDNKDDDISKDRLVNKILNELNFDGFRGAKGEVLPRLQNLQADLSQDNNIIIPVYRYPGNYTGLEWETFDWSPTSRQIKESVEAALKPLYEQKMTHCVTNYYRDGKDCIEHHSDKDLDLNRNGVIVSVSIGDERVLELRRRAEPQDITRVLLPHGSMLVLGPNTNKEYTHSIIRNEQSSKPRISLTLREVMTFVDTKTGRLFGQGVDCKTKSQVRQAQTIESTMLCTGFCALTAIVLSRKKRSNLDAIGGLIIVGSCAAISYSARVLLNKLRQRREERQARDFFSKSSSSGTKY